MVSRFPKDKFGLIKEVLVFLFTVVMVLGVVADVMANRETRERLKINEQIIEARIQERLTVIHSYIKVISAFNPNLNSLFIYELANGIHEASQEHELDSHLILTTIAQESLFDPTAKASTSNATGLGQIIPYHWGERFDFVKADLLDWEFNLDITCRIIKDMKKRHGRRKDWIAFYYSAEQPGRSNYFNQWKRKNRAIQRLLERGRSGDDGKKENGN